MAVTGNTNGLVTELLDKLNQVSINVGKDVFVTSGKRTGDASASSHNTGIGADVKIEGLDTVGVCDELVNVGCSGVGEYYDTDHNPFEFAHGDIRGQAGSEQSGAYAPGGTKSNKLCWWREGTETSGTMHFGSRLSGNSCP